MVPVLKIKKKHLITTKFVSPFVEYMSSSKKTATARTKNKKPIQIRYMGLT